jgi:hypothetical protein
MKIPTTVALIVFAASLANAMLAYLPPEIRSTGETAWPTIL